MDDPIKNVTVRDASMDWKRLPRSKSLFAQRAGVGIVIGNLTSQLLSNIYLDQLDRYVRFTLGYKYYGRYVDDFYIITTMADRPRLVEDLKKIRKYLWSIGLEMHPKKCYAQPVTHGVEFLGATVYLRHFQPGHRVMRNYSKALIDAKKGKNSAFTQLESYEGIFMHFQADRKMERARSAIDALYEKHKKSRAGFA